MFQTPTHAKQAGFTLVELLVVIAIIAVLTTFGLTAVRTMRESANMSVCASNLRNIGIALQMYADDNQGYYPDTTHTTTADKSWIYQLESYLGEFNETRICPADPKAKLRRENKASSYILNSMVFLPTLDAFGEPEGPARNKPALLPDPSATILVFIASDRAGLYPGDDHTHSDQWRGWSIVLRDIAPDRHKQRSSRNSTNGSSNYLYADGRVESIPANEVKAKIEKGINIAAIPGVAP
jgi:prepilin-type N-terminal cleavage/methylation domain-containing protein/prepilin-type processing-associated H-X9-DG protein